MSETASSFDAAVARFRAAHATDPRVVETTEGPQRFAVDYHARLARWVDRVAPDASLALRLAAWCQHLGRHLVPRADFPEGVLGYKKWRSTLARRHAEDAATILGEVGIDDATTKRVGELLQKRGLGRDAEVGLFEDAICLTFLEGELEAFATKHPPDKAADVVRKTWAKMGERGRLLAPEALAEVAAPVRDFVLGVVSG